MGNHARKRRRGIRENAPEDIDNIPDEGGKEALVEEDEALASSSQELNESPVSPRPEPVAYAAPTGENATALHYYHFVDYVFLIFLIKFCIAHDMVL